MTTLTAFERTYIEKKLIPQGDQMYAVQKILAQEGLTEVRDDWKSEFEAMVWNLENLGWMGFEGFEGAKGVMPTYTVKTGKAMVLKGKLMLSPVQLAQARNNQLGIQKGLAEVMAATMRSFSRQWEGMVCCGDATRYAATGDPLAQTTVVNEGVLNGTDNADLNTIAGGTGGDDNVAAFGDFLDTMATAVTAAQNAGLDTQSGHVIMDTGTYGKLAKNRSTNGVPELTMLRESYPKFTLDATNHFLENGATANHYIAVMFPYYLNPETGARGAPAIKYHKTKALHAQPLYNGGLSSDGFFEWLIAVKGGKIVYEYNAIQKTGALTIA